MAEPVLYQSHQSMFRNRPFKFILLFALLIGCIVGLCTLKPQMVGAIMLWVGIGGALLVLLFWWIHCLGQTLIVTDQRVTKRVGILAKNTNDLYHTDIRNVRVNQRFWQRVFGVGKISISSAGTDGMEIEMEGLPKPDKIKSIIDNHRRTDAPRED